MNGKQGAKALEIIAPHRAIPVHFNDYNVFKSPIEDFIKAVNEKGLSRCVTYLSPGELYDFEVQ